MAPERTSRPVILGSSPRLSDLISGVIGGRNRSLTILRTLCASCCDLRSPDIGFWHVAVAPVLSWDLALCWPSRSSQVGDIAATHEVSAEQPAEFQWAGHRRLSGMCHAFEQKDDQRDKRMGAHGVSETPMNARIASGCLIHRKYSSIPQRRLRSADRHSGRKSHAAWRRIPWPRSEPSRRYSR